MRGPEKLLENENHWETRMGGWFPGERVVYRGQDLHVDLDDMGWMELYLYGITGRRFSDAQLKVQMRFGSIPVFLIQGFGRIGWRH